MDIFGIAKLGSWLLPNQKLLNYDGSFGPEIGCLKFHLSDLIRLIVIEERGAKTALIVQKLAHRVMQLLCH